jgi:hypothetical protein
MQTKTQIDTKQIRLWLPNDLYAAIGQLKFAEKNVKQDIRDFAIELIEEGLQARNKKNNL